MEFTKGASANIVLVDGEDLTLVLEGACFPQRRTRGEGSDGRPERSAQVSRLMTCLTVTPATAEEAIARKADLIVTHHPILFRAAKRLALRAGDYRGSALNIFPWHKVQ